MIPALDGLGVVEIEHLSLHEAHDEERLSRVRARIEAEGVQRNPVIATPYGETYLVLDGAHRVQALSGLEANLALVQIVDPPAFTESWAHLIHTAGIEKFRNTEAVETSKIKSADDWLAEVETAEGSRLWFRSRERGLSAEVRALWGMQGGYPRDGEVRRVGADEEVKPVGDEAIVRYRAFSPGELIEVVRFGAILPAGITRFRIEERVLGVRFPLTSLRSKDTAATNADLRAFVEDRWGENRIRRYAEPVVLFE